MIIDAHTHMINSDNFDRLISIGGEWAKKNTEWIIRNVQRKPHLTGVAPRLEQLDRNGIDFQVVTPQHLFDCNVLPADMNARLAFAGEVNDGMAGLMEASKGRLIAAGTVPMAGMEQGGRQEMERAVKTLGLKAFGILSNIEGKPVDAPEFEAFWAAADELDVPIYIHPADPVETTGRAYEAGYDLVHNLGWPFETALMLSRLVFSGVMERYPRLKVVSHHLGGGLIPFFWGRILETYEPENVKKNTWIVDRGGTMPVLSKPLFDYFSRFYFDTAVGGCGPAIKCTHEVFGPDQIVFATDAPWGTGTGEFRLREYPKMIESLGFSEEDKGKILGGNARRMLNLV